MKASGRWLWALPILLVVGIVLIADSLWSDDAGDGARSAPTGAPSPTSVISSPTASPSTEPTAPSPTLSTPTATATTTASPTVSPATEKWSFCKHVSEVDDLRRAVLRGTKPPRALVEQAEALEAHLTAPELDHLNDVVGRLKRAILDAGERYPSDFEVQGWAEALDLVSTTAEVRLGCKVSG